MHQKYNKSSFYNVAHKLELPEYPGLIHYTNYTSIGAVHFSSENRNQVVIYGGG